MKKKLKIRANLFSFIVPYSIFIILISFIGFVFNPSRLTLDSLVIISFAYIIPIVVISMFYMKSNILITKSKLRYQTSKRKVIEININEIEEIEKFYYRGNRKFSPIQYLIKSQDKKIKLDTLLFRKKDIDRVLKVIIQQNPKIKLNEK